VSLLLLPSLHEGHFVKERYGDATLIRRLYDVNFMSRAVSRNSNNCELHEADMAEESRGYWGFDISANALWKLRLNLPIERP
jgi:hypothetical protein